MFVGHRALLIIFSLTLLLVHSRTLLLSTCTAPSLVGLATLPLVRCRALLKLNSVAQSLNLRRTDFLVNCIAFLLISCTTSLFVRSLDVILSTALRDFDLMICI